LRRYGLDGGLRYVEYYSMGEIDSFKIVSEFSKKEEKEIEFLYSENEKYLNKSIK